MVHREELILPRSSYQKAGLQFQDIIVALLKHQSFTRKVYIRHNRLTFQVSTKRKPAEPF